MDDLLIRGALLYDGTGAEPVRADLGVRQGRIRASVLLSIEPRAQANILTRLRAIPEVEKVHTTSGRVDFLLQVSATSTSVLDTILDQIGEMTGVKGSESLIHLSTKIDRTA